MKTILEGLKEYFSSTSEEQILKDWNKSEAFDSTGPSIKEFMEQSKLFYEVENKCPYWEFNYFKNKIENPKFASDFFLIYY